MRALKTAGAAIAAVIVVMALLLRVGIPSGFMTQAIQDRVERETGYRIAISGATRLGIWPTLNVTLNDVSVQDPKARDSDGRLTIGSVQVDITLRSALSGHPQITELVINKPVLHVPLRRERDARVDNSPKPGTAPGDAAANDFTIDPVKVIDGAVILANLHDHFENRVDGINANVTIGADRQIACTGSARSGEHPMKFDIKAELPAGSMGRQNVPVELMLDAGRSLSAKAQVRANGAVLQINGLTGTLDGARFNGWASADLVSKPLVKVDLDFQRLDLGTQSRGQPGTSETSSPPANRWSDEPINLAGLNYVDAQIRMSAAELNIGDARFAPATVDAALGGGALKAQFSHLGVYGGEADGELSVDVSGDNPNYMLRSDLAGVRALPLLSSLADFDKIDGRMRSSRCFAEPGPRLSKQAGPRLCSAPLRKSCALRCVRHKPAWLQRHPSGIDDLQSD